MSLPPEPPGERPDPDRVTTIDVARWVRALDPARDWLRRHRVVAGSVAAVTAVALVAALIMGVRAGDQANEPERVVRDYLHAIRAGDVTEALRIAGDPAVPDSDDTDDTFLTADALADGWEITQVIQRYPGQEVRPAVVDVTLRAPDGATAPGRFELREHDDGGWSIVNPFGQLRHPLGHVDFVELNGVVRPLTEELVTFLVFPGVYQAYSGLDNMAADRTVFVLPGEDSDLLGPELDLGETGAEAAQRAVAAYIDDCAAMSDATPPDCPFSAGDIPPYRDLDDIAWEVVSHPEVVLVTGMHGFQVVPRHAGTVRITGTGIPWGEEERTSFESECDIDLGYLSVRLTAPGEFAVSGRDGLWDTCRL